MNWPAIFWFVLLVFFVMTEAATVTLVSLWFAAGSLAAMIAAFFGGGGHVKAAGCTVTGTPESIIRGLCEQIKLQWEE